MQNINTDDITFWFKPTHDPRRIKVFTTGSTEEVDIDSIENMPYAGDFKIYSSSPEYAVGSPIMTDTYNLKDIKQAYNTLLQGAIRLRYFDAAMLPMSLDKLHAADSVYSAVISWLNTTDFYTAPASSRYHESFEGGLALHCLKVYNRMLDLIQTSAFCSVDIVSATLCVLMHDWCKIGTYSSYMKNVKGDDGAWHQELAYKREPKGIPLGHGDSSMFLASRFFKLSPEEACAIRWHMGKWYVSESEIDDLQRSNETFPMVHLIQFADQLSIVNYC